MYSLSVHLLGEDVMLNVNVTDLRNHLPEYLKKVKAGEEVAVTSRGKVIARLVPETDESAAARQRLEALRGTCRVGDVITPLDDDWEALRADS
jgi:prevent-host-death family protein